MSKAFIAATLQDALGCTGVAAAHAADEIIAAIVAEIKEEGDLHCRASEPSA